MAIQIPLRVIWIPFLSANFGKIFLLSNGFNFNSPHPIILKLMVNLRWSIDS
ncbi:hypothetical protein Lalb_Chr17g0337821 [Lupinus albus]|uniref:Uncharacterized protein n=1 Tax=Lupinus albus TaxID=3870 RepID=A0A6A4P917_LUPAL|nr:hypothetical protein Lalb_Chr17g0337821 [Lupinus albus]